MSLGGWCLDHHTPLPPEAAVCLAIPVDAAMPVPQRVLLLPDVKRTTRTCCSREQIKLNPQLHPIAKFNTKIAAMRFYQLMS
jgi:hypothetical protein